MDDGARGPGAAEARVARLARLAPPPFLPRRGTLWWLDTTILPFHDPEPWRPVVVLAAPPTTAGTVVVVCRSGAGRVGVEHPEDPGGGLPGRGSFSRRLPVQAQLWTERTAVPAGHLDEGALAAVAARFSP